MVVTYTNRHGLPPALAAAIMADRKPKVADFSVTELIGPPRARVLLSRYDVEIDVSDRLLAMLGKAMHMLLEGHGHMTEQTRENTIGGTSVSGTLDEITEDGAIIDYKQTSVWAWIYGGRVEWEQQLNCYAWLDRPRAGGNPTALRVCMIFRDWHKSKSNGPDYPGHFCKTIDVPIWPDAVAEDFIRTRIAAHRAAEIALPDCTPEERWNRTGGYAVMRRGRKSALPGGIHPTEAEARTFAEKLGEGGLYLEHRPGKDVRCLGYCDARSVCDYAKSLHQNGDEE